MRLHPIDGGDARAVLGALPAALDGVRPLALGFTPASDDVVPDGTAAVIATSGSSGIPKRVILSAAALQASGTATAERIGSGRWTLALPAGYVAGLQVLARSLLAGIDPILLDGKLTPDAVIDAADRGSRYISVVPAQLAALVDAADDPRVLAALRAHEAILVGGQALSDVIRMRAAELRIPYVHTYGSSETSVRVTPSFFASAVFTLPSVVSWRLSATRAALPRSVPSFFWAALIVLSRSRRLALPRTS